MTSKVGALIPLGILTPWGKIGGFVFNDPVEYFCVKEDGTTTIVPEPLVVNSGMVMVQLTHAFPWDARGRYVRAYCGVTIKSTEFVREPTCPRCRTILAEREDRCLL